MSKIQIVFLFVFLLNSNIGFADSIVLTPETVLKIADSKNPEISAALARADAEDSMILSASWLDRPKIGLMREQNLNNMQVMMGPMSSWSISQEIKFPAKYFASRSAQSSKADAALEQAQDKRLEIRQKVLTAYYNWYGSLRIQALLAAQKETLREIARAAEARRATGAVPQQDEMKAHVEQTKMENEILLQSQEIADSEAMLRALLNLNPEQDLSLPKEELKAPKLSGASSEDALLKKISSSSRSVKAGEALYEAAKSERTLSWLGFTPDFMLSYRRAYENAPPNAYAISIEASIPLWFFVKEIPEVQAARAKAIEAERNFEKTKRDTEADVHSLKIKVNSYSKLLEIYETSLIPQSISTLNSSRSAYSAGRSTFVELLDSERSLYSNRIAYYQALTKFVESLTRLERALGSSVSDLLFFGEKS